MKQILIIGLITMLLMSMSLVVAEDASEFATNDLSNVSEGLISPEPIQDDMNESVGAGTIFMEKVRLWFTFNQEKKAEQELKLARLELVLANHAAKNNNTAAMEKALDAHNRLIEKIQERMDSMREKAAKINATNEKLVGLERAIEVHGLKIIRLQNILANENLTAEQTAKIEAKIAKAINNTEHLKEVQSAKIEKIKERIQNISEKIEKIRNETECLKEGESGSAFDEPRTKCCEELTSIGYGVRLDSGECGILTNGGFTCTNCGNNICEEEMGEMECNCPEDCKA